jgi:hypothetical protein
MEKKYLRLIRLIKSNVKINDFSPITRVNKVNYKMTYKEFTEYVNNLNN